MPVYTEHLRLRLPLTPMMDEIAFYIKLYRKPQTQTLGVNRRYRLKTYTYRDIPKLLNTKLVEVLSFVVNVRSTIIFRSMFYNNNIETINVGSAINEEVNSGIY